MTTSPTTTFPKPTGDEKISRGTLAYALSRDRQQAYDLIIRELKKAGISQATLARRLDMDPAELSRLLKRPGNWQINTFGALLFALCGAALKYAPEFPSNQQERPESQPVQTVELLRKEPTPSKPKEMRLEPKTVFEANNSINSIRTGVPSTPEARQHFANKEERTPPGTSLISRKINERASALV